MVDLLQPRQGHFEKLSALIAQPEKLAELHMDTPLPQDIPLWLAQLKLLCGVPLHYLVPDEALLPKESIRFFHVDLNWIDCLVEGAYDLGRACEGDLAHDSVF